MRKGILGVLLVFLILAVVDRGWSQCMMMGGHEKMGHRGGMKGERGGEGFFLGMKEALNLTDDQVAKLKAIRKETGKKQIENEAKLKNLHLELEDLLLEEKVDRNKVDSTIDQIGKLHSEMKKIAIHARLDAKALLTPEQFKKLKELKGEGRKMYPGMGMYYEDDEDD